MTAVPFLWKPDLIKPIAMFLPTVGASGIPDVTTPTYTVFIIVYDRPKDNTHLFRLTFPV